MYLLSYLLYNSFYENPKKRTPAIMPKVHQPPKKSGDKRIKIPTYTILNSVLCLCIELARCCRPVVVVKGDIKR